MRPTLKDECNAKQVLEELDTFENSLLHAIITEEIDLANRKQIHDMGENPNMPNKELHFRRGAIFANDSFFTMFQSLRNLLEGRTALETAEKQTKGK